MPGPVVLLPSKNAILDLLWVGCSPIFCSSKCLPGRGLAGSARDIAVVQGCEEQPAPHRGRRLPWRDLPAAQPTAVGPGDTVLWVLHPASALRQLKNSQPCSVPRRTASPCHGAGLHGIAPPRHGAGKATSGCPAPGWGCRMLRSTRLVAPCPLPGVTWCLAGGPWGQRSLSTWPALPPALPTDTQAGAEEGHQETPARHEGKRWQWREK